jgi:hypothetical protein
LPYKYPSEYTFFNDENYQKKKVIYIGIDNDIIRRTKISTDKILVYWNNKWNTYHSIDYWNNSVDIKELAKGLKTQDWIDLFGTDALNQIKIK